MKGEEKGGESRPRAAKGGVGGGRSLAVRSKTLQTMKSSLPERDTADGQGCGDSGANACGEGAPICGNDADGCGEGANANARRPNVRETASAQ